MKANRIFTAFLAVVLVLTILPTGSLCSVSAADEPSDTHVVAFDSPENGSIITVYSDVVSLGDADADGKISATDYMKTKMFFSGEYIPPVRFALDADGDGHYNLKDSFLLRKIYSEGSLIASNTAVEKSYDGDESAYVLTYSGENDLFDIDLSGAAGSKYVSIVWKNVTGARFRAIGGNLEVISSYYPENFEPGKYSVVTVPVSERAECIEVSYSADGPVYIDSIVFSKASQAAETAAAERAELRRGVPESKFFAINFDSPASLADFTNSNHTTASYNASYNALKLQVSGGNGDPWILLDLDKYGISADEYKYIVYTSMIPSENHQPQPEGELFYAAGDIPGPTAGYSNIYSQIKDGAFHSKIFEMTNADFWTGQVHSLRFDYYCACAVGDTQYVTSVVFCNTYEAALEVAVDKTNLTTDYKQLFNYGIYDNGSFKLSYRYYVPYGYDNTNKYPALVLLHGAGERGTDGTYHLTGGFPYLFNNTSNPAFGSIVIAPQCPTGYQWVDTPWGQGNYSTDAVPQSEPMTAVVEILDNVFNNYSVDRDRVYASGLSMGGFGTWDLLARHSDIFAAGVPICGGGDPSKANILKDIPIRTFHGTADNVVPFRGTQEMYNAIIAAGGTKISFTSYGGADHFIWDTVYSTGWVFDWLFEQSMADR